MKKILVILFLGLAGCIAQYQAPSGGNTALLSFSHTDGGVAEYFYLPNSNSCSTPQFIGHIGPGFPMKGVLNDKNNTVPAGEEIGILVNVIPPGYPYAGQLCKHKVQLTLENGQSYELQTNLSECTALFGTTSSSLTQVDSSGC